MGARASRVVAGTVAAAVLLGGCASGPFDLDRGGTDGDRGDGSSATAANPLGCRAPSIGPLVEDAAGSRITVAPDVLMGQGEPYCEREGDVADGWESGPAFVVVPRRRTAAERDRAVAAVDAVARRMVSIDQDSGRPFEEWEGMTKVGPAFISGPVVHDDGAVSLWFDTDGWLSVPLGRTLVRLFVEELSERGLASSLGVAPTSRIGDRSAETLWDEDGPSADDAEDEPTRGPSRWHLLRSVPTTTTDGRGYEDVDWWGEDGRWTSDRSAAMTFDQDERAAATRLAVRLRREAPASGGPGEPTAVLLAPDEDPWPQPPASLERPR